jgi:hypothetical protein
MAPVTEQNIDLVLQDYESILDKLLDEGMELGKAKREAQQMSILLHEETEHVARGVSLDRMTLRQTLSLESVEKLPTVVNNGGWDKLGEGEKEDLLWELGFDSKAYGWKTEVGMHQGTSGKPTFDKYVVSNERVDTGWATLVIEGKNVASFEARMEHAGDKSLYSEISRLGGL